MKTVKNGEGGYLWVLLFFVAAIQCSSNESKAEIYSNENDYLKELIEGQRKLLEDCGKQSKPIDTKLQKALEKQKILMDVNKRFLEKEKGTASLEEEAKRMAQPSYENIYTQDTLLIKPNM